MSCAVTGAQWLQGSPCLSSKSLPRRANLRLDSPSRCRSQAKVAFSCFHSEHVLSLVSFYKLMIASPQIYISPISRLHTDHTTAVSVGFSSMVLASDGLRGLMHIS